MGKAKRPGHKTAKVRPAPSAAVEPRQPLPVWIRPIAGFAQRKPLWFWGTVWILLLLAGISSVSTLLSPSASRSDALTTLQVKEEPEDPQETSIWLFTMLVFSCAFGCLVLSRYLLMPPRPRPPKPKAKPTPRPAPIVPVASLPAAPTPAPAPTPVAAPTPPVTRKPIPVQQSLVVAQAKAMVAQPKVTVVPEDESHPLDWGEAGLAEVMDMRKQRPLSSLL